MPRNNGGKIDPTIVKVALYGGGIIVGYSLLKRLLPDADGGVPEEYEKYLQNKYAMYVAFIRDTLGPSIKQSNLQFERYFYKQAAETLYKAMNGAGTNETVILNTLKGLNPDDLKTIYMDYGLRPPTFHTPWGDVATGDRMDLIDWFIDDMSGSTLNKVMQIWKPTHLVPQGY